MLGEFRDSLMFFQSSLLPYRLVFSAFMLTEPCPAFPSRSCHGVRVFSVVPASRDCLVSFTASQRLPRPFVPLLVGPLSCVLPSTCHLLYNVFPSSVVRAVSLPCLVPRLFLKLSRYRQYVSPSCPLVRPITPLASSLA